MKGFMLIFECLLILYLYENNFNNSLIIFYP